MTQPIDFHTLVWLVGRTRHGDDHSKGRSWWLNEIRADYGDAVADSVLAALEAEDDSRLTIEEARREYHARLADTYLIVLAAYEQGEQA